MCRTDVQMYDRYMEQLHRCAKCVTADASAFKVKVLDQTNKLSVES